MTDTRSGGPTPALLTAALSVVTVVLVLLGAFLAWRYVHFEDGPSHLGGDRSGWVSDDERNSALDVAEQFALRNDAIDGAHLDAWAGRIKPLLTTKCATGFEKSLTLMKQVPAARDMKGTGQVLASALSDIDPDSATALVVHDAVVTTKQGSTGRHYRWTLQLDKVHGDWLVDSWTDDSGTSNGMSCS